MSMKTAFASAWALFAISVACWGDDVTKQAQEALKTEGFYDGEATGAVNAETKAAIKRYQIRNGLEVTGSLNKETLEALNLDGNAVPEAPAPAPALKPPPRKPAPPVDVEKDPETRRPPAGQPPVNLRNQPTERDDDREFLRRDPSRPPQPQPSGPPPDAGARPGGGLYGHLYARTPYASAPLEVQQSTTVRAQKFLKDLSFYRDSVDGRPSPALEEAILGYQRFIKLPLTGQLDLETLSAMRLLPGRGGSPARPVSRPSDNSKRRVLRGVLVD